jgi:hypothetical protein
MRYDDWGVAICWGCVGVFKGVETVLLVMVMVMVMVQMVVFVVVLIQGVIFVTGRLIPSGPRRGAGT